MQKGKKTIHLQEDLKIVSRPSNEELDDQIMDEENQNYPINSLKKKKTKSDFGEGIED